MYCIVLYCIVLYCIVLYCIVLYIQLTLVGRSKDPWGYMKSATRKDPLSILTHVQPGPNSSPTALADTVNEAFLEPMSTFTPLGPVSTADARYSNPPSVSEFRVLKKLSVLNPAKSSGPDMIPSWLLKENADLLGPAVTDIINCSFGEARLQQSWKHADIVPIPKQMPVYDVNKHLWPIFSNTRIVKSGRRIRGRTACKTCCA